MKHDNRKEEKEQELSKNNEEYGRASLWVLNLNLSFIPQFDTFLPL